MPLIIHDEEDDKITIKQEASISPIKSHFKEGHSSNDTIEQARDKLHEIIQKEGDKITIKIELPNKILFNEDFSSNETMENDEDYIVKSEISKKHKKKRKKQLPKLPQKTEPTDTVESKSIEGMAELKCNECDFVTGYVGVLARHKKRSHSGDQKAYLCGHCDLWFETFKDQRLHIQKTHDIRARGSILNEKKFIKNFEILLGSNDFKRHRNGYWLYPIHLVSLVINLLMND
jgi:hypothetical protein